MSNGNSRSLANKNVKTLTSRVVVGGIYDKEYMTLFGNEHSWPKFLLPCHVIFPSELHFKMVNCSNKDYIEDTTRQHPRRRIIFNSNQLVTDIKRSPLVMYHSHLPPQTFLLYVCV